METAAFKKEYREKYWVDEMALDEARSEPIPEDPTCLHDDLP